MFHRKRHHHHQPQHSRGAAVANRQADPSISDPHQTVENETPGMKQHSEPSPVGPDFENEPAAHSSSRTETDSDFSHFRRRCTSPVCATAVELAAGMVDGFRLPDHSPSPVRKQMSSPVSGRSLSAASPESGSNATSSSSSSPSSSLTGLFRRKRSPMDLSSQSFHFKTSSSLPSTKPSTPPKPQRLDAGTYPGSAEHKGRSLSPMPSGNLLASMVINSIHSAVLDVGQSASEHQSRKASSTVPHHRHHNQHNHPLPQLVINAKSDELATSEPTSPSLTDSRQN